MEIRKVAILGVGAIGSYILAGLSGKPGIQLSVVGSGERKQRYELFENTEVHYHVTDHILLDMWMKFRLNIGKNLVQAIIGAGIGAYYTSKHLEWISFQLQKEVNAVALACGIELEPIPSFKWPENPNARFSTLQDLDNGRETEIEMFSGALIRLGQKLGITVCPELYLSSPHLPSGDVNSEIRKKVRILPFPDNGQVDRIAIGWNRNRYQSAAVKAFIDDCIFKFEV